MDDQQTNAQMERLEAKIIENHKLFSDLFATPQGRLVLDKLRETYHAATPCYQTGMTPQDHAYNEGQRSVVLYIEQCLIDPQQRIERIKNAQRYS